MLIASPGHDQLRALFGNVQFRHDFYPRHVQLRSYGDLPHWRRHAARPAAATFTFQTGACMVSIAEAAVNTNVWAVPSNVDLVLSSLSSQVAVSGTAGIILGDGCTLEFALEHQRNCAEAFRQHRHQRRSPAHPAFGWPRQWPDVDDQRSARVGRRR